MEISDVITYLVGIIGACLVGFGYYYGTKKRARDYCWYYNLDFKSFWHDDLRNRIDFSNPDWDIPYLIPGRPRVYSKYEIIEAEIKRRKMAKDIEFLTEATNKLREDFKESTNPKHPEPKFKVGDWVVCKGFENTPARITKVLSYRQYQWIGVRNAIGWITDEEDLENWRLWTIKDAKYGDVLYSPKGLGVEAIHLIREWKNIEGTGRTLCSSYTYRVEDDEIVYGGIGAVWWEGVLDSFFPATEEQRKLLMDKIKEYLDKKKLKKETAIILKGVRYDLVKPQIESCSNCDLDKFCDKFKEALCDMLEGKHCGKVFKKQ